MLCKLTISSSATTSVQVSLLPERVQNQVRVVFTLWGVQHRAALSGPRHLSHYLFIKWTVIWFKLNCLLESAAIPHARLEVETCSCTLLSECFSQCWSDHLPPLFLRPFSLLQSIQLGQSSMFSCILLYLFLEHTSNTHTNTHPESHYLCYW